MKYFILFCISILFLYVHIKEQRNKTRYNESIIKFQRSIDSLRNIADSIYIDNYPCQIELNRYKLAYDILLERNPKAASQYEHIISNETE
jgi:hypothetical protein